MCIQMPNDECDHIFIANYNIDFDEFAGIQQFYFQNAIPNIPEELKISNNLKEVSLSFYKIYRDAILSESYGLIEICGVGYRKALEFLIKDFIIQRADKLGITDINKIAQSTKLGKLIDDYITDYDIKEAAKRAAWLGNDETHYYRIWIDKDLRDLKLLLTLTIGFINNKLTLEKYIVEMELKIKNKKT